MVQPGFMSYAHHHHHQNGLCRGFVNFGGKVVRVDTGLGRLGRSRTGPLVIHIWAVIDRAAVHASTKWQGAFHGCSQV